MKGKSSQAQDIEEYSILRCKDWKKMLIKKSPVGVIIAFLFLGCLVFMDEIFDLPHLIFGVPSTPINWAEIAIETTIFLIVGSILVYVLCVIELKRDKAEEALRNAEQDWRNSFDSLEDIMLIIDRDWNIEKINGSGLKLLGKSRDELIGRKCYEAIYNKDAPPEFCPCRKSLETKKAESIERYDEVFESYFSIMSSPILDENGEVVKVVELMRDITEREKAKERLRQAVEELKRSNTELEQFAYVTSHDLQEPLRMISSYVQLLSERYKGKLDSDADDFIGYAVDGANRMQTQIQDLLTYSRIGTRGKPFEPTDCEDVLEQVLSNLKMAIEESGAEVTHDTLPTVMVDNSQLVQLFQNLIENAIKFRGDELPRIHVSATRELEEITNYEYWLFSVRDNGIGIKPEFFERIFEIFQRLHGRGEYSGTGIGLAVCKKIVERHGGQIWVESEPGNGAKFFFTILDRAS